MGNEIMTQALAAKEAGEAMSAAGNGSEMFPQSLRLLPAVGLAALACAAYGIGFAVPLGASAVLVALPCLCLLARASTARRGFYYGLLAGLGMYVPHLVFFKTIFGLSAGALWVVAAFPVGIFVMLLSLTNRRLGPAWACWLTPMLWTAVEYFRSELYYLRFAWLLPGQAAAFLPGVRLARIGVYGLGFLYMFAAAMIIDRRPLIRAVGLIALLGQAALMYLPARSPVAPRGSALQVAGVQLESPSENEAVAALDRLAIKHPEAQILVLSEYTFDGPVPEAARDVLRRHRRYLVAGGVRRLEDGRFHDSAFVVGPDGQDVFEQGKSVPVQFMGDGLPATDRRVWESPWGKIGIAVCYDLSYARVMDDFVRQGAQGLIIPTMDVARWGEYERRMLHGRLAPVRSAEYGIPTFGVWSSGVSQLTDASGQVIATAGYPGQGMMIAGLFHLHAPGHVPPDRPLAIASTAGTGALIAWLIFKRIKGKA